MKKFLSLLTSIIFETTQYSHSLDPKIEKLDPEFKKFYFLDFKSFLFKKGTKAAIETDQGIERFKNYCKNQPLSVLIGFLNFAEIGLEEEKRENISIPTDGDLEEKLKDVLKSKTINKDTVEIINKSKQNYLEKTRQELIRSTNNYNNIKNELDKISDLTQRRKKKKEAKEKYEMEQKRISDEYSNLIKMDIKNLTTITNAELIEQKNADQLRLSILEKIKDDTLEAMLKQQSEILTNKNKIEVSKDDITKYQVQHNSSIPLINPIIDKWNNVLEVFSQLSKNVLDERNKRNLSSGLNNNYLFFAPLFFDKDILDGSHAISINNDIKENQYDNILSKSFLKDLPYDYLSDIKKNKSRQKRLIIEKIVSVLKKSQNSYDISPTKTLSNIQIPQEIIKEVIKKDEIEKIINQLDKISDNDIEYSFKNGANFGYVARIFTDISKSLNKIDIIDIDTIKNEYKEIINDSINKFEDKMVSVASYLLDILELDKGSLTRDQLTLSNTLNGFDGILSRIGFDEVKDKLRKI
jgi:hypothetical protein